MFNQILSLRQTSINFRTPPCLTASHRSKNRSNFIDKVLVFQYLLRNQPICQSKFRHESLVWMYYQPPERQGRSGNVQWYTSNRFRSQDLINFSLSHSKYIFIPHCSLTMAGMFHFVYYAHFDITTYNIKLYHARQKMNCSLKKQNPNHCGSHLLSLTYK